MNQCFPEMAGLNVSESSDLRGHFEMSREENEDWSAGFGFL